MLHPQFTGLWSTAKMIIQDLFESVSDVVYHYTNIWAGAKIMTQGHFELSSVLGSDYEYKFSPPGYMYFFSTTRTRTGGYHDFVGSSAVMFVLDGSWFNARYPGHAVDYWQNRNPMGVSHRAHEAEDRVFSRSPTIPIDGVKSVHVLVKDDADTRHRTWARRLIIAAKKRGIPSYLYDNQKAWRQLDKRQKISMAALRGIDEPSFGGRRHRGYLMPWMELIFGRDRSKLSKKASSLLYGLDYYGHEGIIKSLSVDLSNARKPDSGPDREHATKIIQYMKQHKLHSVEALADHIAQRWKRGTTEKQDLGENDDEHQLALQQTGFWGRQGAGCVFMALDTGRLCLAHRSEAVEQPGTWGTWGGAIDSDEDPGQAVRREVAEEAGYQGSLDLIPLLVFSHPSGFRYHNFLALVPREFQPRLNWETQGWDWFDPGDWPKPLHPGVKSLLADRHSLDIIQKYHSKAHENIEVKDITDEGEVIRTKFATKQAQRAQDRYQHQPDIEIPLYDPRRGRAVLPQHVGTHDEELEFFDHFVASPSAKNPRVWTISGVTRDQREIKFSTILADVEQVRQFIDAMNRGGFSTVDINRVPMGPKP